MEECDLCKRENESSRILLETKNFYVMPTLGQIIEGYLVICTKEHYIGLSHLPEKLLEELEDLKEKCKEVLGKVYTSPLFFEHGSITECNKAGACIDHAHLHVVPFETDIFEDIAKNFKPRKISNLKEVRIQNERQVPYLYYENQKGDKYVFEINSIIPSQYLRQVISSKTKEPFKWDWRTYPQEELVKKSVEKLKPLFKKFY